MARDALVAVGGEGEILVAAELVSEFAAHGAAVGIDAAGFVVAFGAVVVEIAKADVCAEGGGEGVVEARLEYAGLELGGVGGF